MNVPSPRLERLLFGSVLAVALWARLSRAPAILVEGTLVALDGDSVRHLERMAAAARDGLRVSPLDPLVNWPFGNSEPWAPGFDVVGGALMLAFGGPDSLSGRLAACVLPVLLGLGVVALTVRVARALGLSSPTALAAGLLVALSPQMVSSSLLGRTDHHVWEAASLLGLTGWALTPAAATRWRRELTGGALVFATLWGFDGGTIYVALATVALALPVLRDGSPRPLVGSGALALALGAAAAALAYAPMLAQHGVTFSFRHPSLVQPLLVGLAALALALTTFAVGRAGPSPARRAGAVALVALFVAGALVAIAPLRRELLAGLSQWLAKTDPWLGSIAEFQPPAGFSGLIATFGAWVVIAPLLLPLGAWLLGRRGDEGVQFAFVALAAAGLTLLQMRFGRVAIPLVALTCLAALELSARFFARAALQLAGPVLALLAVGLDGQARGFLVLREPEVQKPIVELSLALRRLEPEHRGLGVLANWEDGHFIEALAQHPVLANGHGTWSSPEGFAASATFWTGTPASLDALLAERRLGWWIDGAAHFLARHAEGRDVFTRKDGKVFLEPKVVRDWPLTVALFGGSGDVKRRVPHLEHFWPRAASSASSVELGLKLPDLWLFERVEGAVVTGVAQPSSVVQARLQLGPFPWTAWTTAGPDGSFRLRLPIPSRAEGELPTSDWTVLVDGRAVPLTVTEAAVRTGASLAL